MHYYPRIKDLRESKKLSQKEMANILKCSQVCYSRYEQGQRDIPTETLIILADIFDTSTDYILGRIDSPENPK